MNHTELDNTMNSTGIHHVQDSSCGGATDLQLEWFLSFAWWVEGFLQLFTGTKI